MVGKAKPRSFIEFETARVQSPVQFTPAMRTEGRVLQEVHGNRGKAFDAPLLPAKLGGAETFQRATDHGFQKPKKQNEDSIDRTPIRSPNYIAKNAVNAT